MTKEELNDLYSKVINIIWNYNSYHVIYTCGEEHWDKMGNYVSFEVYGYSDQGEGSNWTEDWTIYSDGSINADGKNYKNFEEFLLDW